MGQLIQQKESFKALQYLDYAQLWRTAINQIYGVNRRKKMQKQEDLKTLQLISEVYKAGVKRSVVSEEVSTIKISQALCIELTGKML